MSGGQIDAMIHDSNVQVDLIPEMIVSGLESRKLIEEDVICVLAATMFDYGDAFIAGGYLRDRILGVKPRDVDIFTFMDLQAGRMFTSESDGQSDGLGQHRIAGTERVVDPVVDLSPLCKYRVEVIHLLPAMASRAKDAVAQFAFGIQQIMYDPIKDQILMSRQFQKDLDNKQMTVWRTIDEAEASNIYHIKFESLRRSDRFPGWKMVIPKRFAWAYKLLSGITEDADVIWRED